MKSEANHLFSDKMVLDDYFEQSGRGQLNPETSGLDGVKICSKKKEQFIAGNIQLMLS